MKKKEKRIFNYMLHLNKSEWEALDSMKIETGRTKADILREPIVAYLSKEERTSK